MRLTTDEYAMKYKMSREMIYSKIRSKKLHSINENGTVYIIIDDETEKSIKTLPKNSMQKKIVPSTKKTSKTTVGTILSLYQKENHQLKLKIKQLEDKVDSLINDKEEMLREERDRLESVYIKKDEQLKTILELINTKLMFDNEKPAEGTIHDVNLDDKQKRLTPIDDQESTLVELKTYLKTLDLTAFEKKIIKKRFRLAYGSDIRVYQQNGNFYLNFAHYDYSDLLEKP